MKTLFVLHTSLNGTGSLSSSLATEYAERWHDAHPEGRVVVRDLASTPVPHLTADVFAAFAADEASRSPAQRDAVALSDELIAELQAADEIALAVPMYNFGIPSTLKAYFDHVARAGVTFHYTSNGPEGLLTGRRATVFIARGGRYTGTPSDLQTQYLEMFLGFLGFEQPRFVYAEGTAMGDDAVDAALAGARARIDELTARVA